MEKTTIPDWIPQSLPGIQCHETLSLFCPPAPFLNWQICRKKNRVFWLCQMSFMNHPFLPLKCFKMKRTFVNLSYSINETTSQESIITGWMWIHCNDIRLIHPTRGKTSWMINKPSGSNRAGAKYETCSQSLASDIFAVGANPEVTYQFPANLAEQRPPARGLKFRPRSTGGRFFEVGILAWN